LANIGTNLRKCRKPNMDSAYPKVHKPSFDSGVGLHLITPARQIHQHLASPDSVYKEIFDSATSPSKRQRFFNIFKGRHWNSTSAMQENASTKEICRRNKIISEAAPLRSLRATGRDDRSILASTYRCRAETVSPTKPDADNNNRNISVPDSQKTAYWQQCLNSATTPNDEKVLGIYSAQSPTRYLCGVAD
jgi:hypothetical protein